MATVVEVRDAVVELKTKLEAYVATQQGSATAADLDTLKAAVEAVTAVVPA